MNDQNEVNLQSCVRENSEILGKCILDCGDDNQCENKCVVDFKNDHKFCPCQVWCMIYESYDSLFPIMTRYLLWQW